MTKKSGDIVLALVCIGISLVFLFGQDLSYPVNVFPYSVIGIILFISVLIGIRAIFSDLPVYRLRIESVLSKRVTLLVVFSAVYIFVFPVVGFYTSSFVYLIFLSMQIQTKETPFKKRVTSSFIMASIVIVFVYVLFTLLLRVPTPRGFLA